MSLLPIGNNNLNNCLRILCTVRLKKNENRLYTQKQLKQQEKTKKQETFRTLLLVGKMDKKNLMDYDFKTELNNVFDIHILYDTYLFKYVILIHC